MEERRLDFDMDLGERQYKVDMERLEIERSKLDKVETVQETRAQSLGEWMDHIETKMDQIIQLLRLPTA